ESGFRLAGQDLIDVCGVIRRTALVVAAAAAVIVLIAHCSNKPACDALSCPAGCCDPNGVCALGDAVEACGAPGSGQCKVCGIKQYCIDGMCQAVGGGPGGGAAGGGLAAGGGFPFGGGSGGGLTTDCPQDGGGGLCLNGVCVDGVCVPDNSDSGTGG